MKSHDYVMEQYEDALFAVIMDEITAKEGEELLRENESLKRDPGFAVPEQTDRQCHKTIAQAFRKQKRARAAHAAWRVLQRVAVAVFAGLVLFLGAYAAFPQVRNATLNLLVEVSDVATSMRFGESSVPATEGVLLPYEFGELPDGFTLAEAGNDGVKYWKIYTNDNAAEIILNVVDGSDNTWHKFDTEDTDNTESIEVNGNVGFLVEKNSGISATIADKEHLIIVDILFQGLSREDALNVISNLVYTGQDF